MSTDSVNEFWDWAVGRYEDRPVRDALLELQETAGLIILEAMFLAWLGRRGQVISGSEQQRIREAITPWVEGVVLPLRQQRQAWTDNSSMMINRRYLLGLELEAERALAQLLINSLTILDAVTGSPSDIDQNLVLIPELADAASRAGVTDMLAR
ncbi:MAG: TIGR02444 family protein [Luminiphilus sp.]